MSTDDEKRCEICGRRLKTPASRARGRGPVCDEKVNPDRGRDHSPRTARPAGRGRRAATAAGAPSLLDVLEQP